MSKLELWSVLKLNPTSLLLHVTHNEGWLWWQYFIWRQLRWIVTFSVWGNGGQVLLCITLKKDVMKTLKAHISRVISLQLTVLSLINPFWTERTKKRKKKLKKRHSLSLFIKKITYKLYLPIKHSRGHSISHLFRCLMCSTAVRHHIR